VAPNAVKTFTLGVAPANTDVAPNFTGTPGGGTAGSAYNFTFTGITGSPAPTFALSPTPVAGGITISSAGVLSGTPTTAGSFPITVTASNGVAPNAVKTFTLVVAPASTGSAPDFSGTPTAGTAGTAYHFSFTGITGSPTPTFTMTPGTVDGITISAAGVLSGTPTAAGSFPITVKASNGVSPDAAQAFVLVVNPKDNRNHHHFHPPVCAPGGKHFNGWIWTWLVRRVHSQDEGFAWMHLCFPKHHWTAGNSNIWARCWSNHRR
jgi:hypothetical protein